jgi:putative transposase
LGEGNIDTMTRYRCVDAQRAEGFAVTAACKVMQVTRSAYYHWTARGRPGRDALSEADEATLTQIRQIHAEHPDYGSPRITTELARRGHPCNHKRVERLMADHGIVARRTRMRRCTTKPDPTAAPIPDLVGRLFDPDRLDHTWVGDVTYIPTDEGWLYLATVVDLASRRLIGYSMADRADTAHIISAVEMAVTTRGRTKMDNTIFHSDRGSTYMSEPYGKACHRLGLRRSAGRTGSCLDNAVAESFFATLKGEIGQRRFATRAAARQAVFVWINYYNNHRIHTSCDNRPPVEYESLLTRSVDLIESVKAA